jgi:hypothetical protein
MSSVSLANTEDEKAIRQTASMPAGFVKGWCLIRFVLLRLDSDGTGCISALAFIFNGFMVAKAASISSTLQWIDIVAGCFVFILEV